MAERLGLGPEICLARNPKLVYGRMTGWGQTGPMALAAGHDIDYIALAGALEPIGREGEKPLPPLNLVGDFGGGGMLLAFGMLAAILSARQTGEPQVLRRFTDHLGRHQVGHRAHLRPGVLAGAVLSQDAVGRRGQLHGPFSGQSLASIETPNAKTIVFHLTRPTVTGRVDRQLMTLAPVPTARAPTPPTTPRRSPPARTSVSSYQNGVVANLVRNPHWDQTSDPNRPALPDKIIVQMSQDDSVISQRLIADSGNDQYAFGESFVSPAQLAQLQGNASAIRNCQSSRCT